MSIKSISQEKFVMVTYEFGNAIYIAPLKSLQIQITDKKEDAEMWDLDDTLSIMKLNYHKAVTGYSKLTFEKI